MRKAASEHRHVMSRVTETSGQTMRKKSGATVARPPGLRVDGGRRIDLAAKRAKKAAAKEANQPARRVLTVAEVKARVAADRKRRAAEKRRLERLREIDGGKEGAKLSVVKLRLSANRDERVVMRAKPGTFEWLYGRDKQDALWHAGNHLAQLFERGGYAIASSADFLRGTKSGPSGITGARLSAVQELEGFVREVGRKPSNRLMAYCGEGLTARQIASKEGIGEREAAVILRSDLMACAEHFNFIGAKR